MKNKNKILISVIVSVVLLVVIVFASIKLLPKFTSKYDGELTIVVVDDKEKKIFDKKVGFNAGETFMDVIDRNLTIEYESSEFGRMIISINGKKQGNNFWWVYTRNGDFTPTGVDSQEFADGDVFLFELKNFG